MKQQPQEIKIDKRQASEKNKGNRPRKKINLGFLEGLGLGVVGGLVLGYFLFQSSVRVAVEFEPKSPISSISADVTPSDSGAPVTREEMVKKAVQEDDAQPLYQSSCLIEVKPINTNHPALITRRFIHTQFTIILAPSTLNLAVDAIHLESRWKKDRKEVLKTLREIVTAELRRGTDLIEISVVHQNKEDAQMICKAVYQAYAHRRRELEIGMRKEQLKAIKVELQNRSDRVAELRQRLMDITEKSGQFNIARKEYQTALAIKDNMEVLYDVEKTKMVMPVTNVIVHEEPTIQEVRSK